MVGVHTKAAWLTIKQSLVTIYNDIYDEHLFVFAAGLSYYFVLSLFPLLVSMASLLGYVPIPHLFQGLCKPDGQARSRRWDELSAQHPVRFGPNFKQRFRDSLIGAIVAVVTWVGLSYLLGVYFQHFESLNKTYGPLGAAIGLYLWFYLSGFAILLGGEINFLRGELRNRRALRSSTLARCEIDGMEAARRKSRGTKPLM